ncbi:hypothetical protein DRO29_00490, partial [Candidatus Bathyarchaeota archaeon]
LLRKAFDVDEIDLLNYYLADSDYDIVVTHPIFYPFTHKNPLLFCERLGQLERIREQAPVLVGFEVTDSDKIADYCVEIVNSFYDAVIVPSTFSCRVMYNSGVRKPCYVVPHGIHPELLKADPDKAEMRNYDLRYAYETKRNLKRYYVLFFLWHSGWRKGADIVADAMKIVQSKRPDVVLVIKCVNPVEPFLKYFRGLKTILVRGWLTWNELALLYRLADVSVCPSRGGGFELNALESIAMGVPTIAHAYGCFADYSRFLITAKADYGTKVIPDNHIHIGKGWTVDANALAEKIIDIIDNYEEYKAKFEKYAEEVRKIYNWERIGDLLINMFSKLIKKR